MATITRYVDDLTGKEISEDEGGPVIFCLQGEFYQLDLGPESLAKLEKALQPYMDKALSIENPYAEAPRRPGRPAGARGTSLRNQGGGAAQREYLARVREWAREQGYSVADRGRIAGEIQEAFAAAGGK